MKLLGIFAVIGGCGWIVVSTFRQFARRQYPLFFRIASIVLGATGLALGAWLVSREYLESPTVRLTGYPFSVGGYEFYGGRWLGGVSRIGLFALVADVLAGVALCLSPLRIAQFIFERRAT